MSANAVTKTTARKKLHVDAEAQSLMASPGFRRLLEAGRRSASQGLLSNEDLDRQRPISDEEAAEADERVAQLEAEDKAAADGAHSSNASH